MSAGAATSSPAFVQQVSVHSTKVSKVTLTLSANIGAGNRLVVLVGVWSSSGATAKSVIDSAGNTYVELVHFKASDNTEESAWTAPISAGAGTRPTITVTSTAAADVGAAVSEYSGLSTVSDASVLDQVAHATGTTGAAGNVTSGATSPTGASGELAIGVYVDSGFGDSLSGGAGFTTRTNVSKTSNIELLGEDQTLAAAGATPSATVGTGANTTWLMATLVLRGASSGTATAPGAPTGVAAAPGDGSATVSWTAPPDGGSGIGSYTVTPYIGSAAQTPTQVTGSPPSTNATVTGLTNGTTYTFVVTATNAIGTGPPSSPSGPVTPSPSSGGQWSSLMNWPMVAVHSVLLPNGNLLQWDGWQQPEPTQVWNPSSQTFTNQTAPDSIFCAGVAELPDGRVLVVGGYGGLSTGKLGIVDTSIFDPATSTWTRVSDMHYARWYPDLTELADGRYVAISGNSTDAGTWADAPEVYDPARNTWTTLANVKTSQVHEEEYPFSYLVPNGDVFTIGPSEDKSFLLDVGAQTWTQVGGSSGVVNGSSVMYRPGKILYSGGTATHDTNSPANTTTAVIDLTAQTPTWRQTAPMQYGRVYHTLTMLADGTVLTVGGEPTWGQTGSSEVSGGILPSEIWNPATETWSPAAPTAVTRGYHSTAILMQDATVLVAGSGHEGPNDPGQDSAQIYSPPYLFKGPRPTISAAPGAATYGSTIPISTPNAGSISAVNLVSLGADTHQSDMDQHFVPLNFTQDSGDLNVQIPSSAAFAPPGHYMLFIVNSAGVPSVASMINIAPSLAPPGSPTGVSAVAGNGSASVSWTAPSDGGSPITNYTVIPYAGSTALTPTTVQGSPPATATTINGLTNGTPYTFTVSATNSVGTSPESSPSNSVTPTSQVAPAFIQAASGHAANVTSLSVVPTSSVVSGDRLVVEAAVWSTGGATAKSVTDSAGDQFVELLHYKASEGTEMSVWTAPVTAGGGTTPTITVTPSAKADVGVGALEYSGLSSVADATVTDGTAHATGTTTTAGSVASGATARTSSGNELALGFYADSGFGDKLTAGSGYTARVNASNASDIEVLAEDQVITAAGSTPNASADTGAHTTWLMATVVLKPASVASGAAAPSGVGLEMTGLGGSPLDAHNVLGSTTSWADFSSPAAPIATMSNQPTAFTPRCLKQSSANRNNRSCASVRRTARITAAARARFLFEALLKGLPNGLFCNHGRRDKLADGWTAWLKPSSA